jgi:6-phosphofructokinase 1
MKRTSRRIGVLTGGGDCPGLNAVIRAVTKAAVFKYGLEVYGIEDGVLGLIQNRIRPLRSDDVSNILTVGGTILGSSNKVNPHHYPVRRGGDVVHEDVTARILDHVAYHGLEALVTIGGDGTQSMAADLVSHGVHCVGVPKTIDNDIMHCDLSFGFDTAVATATECLDRIHTTAMSHHRVMVVEVMGRNAGWLGLHAGVASGSDIVLIPEVPYQLEHVGEALQARRRRGKRFSIVCVSEGAHAEGEEPAVKHRVEGAPDPVRLGGIAARLAGQIEDRYGMVTRYTILGHVQRGGSPTPFDRVLATRYGYEAVKLLMRGGEARMVTWRDGGVASVELDQVANRQRKVPLDHPLIAAAHAVGTSLGDGSCALH